MNYLNYIILVSICLAIFYSCYHLMFRNEKFAQLNRIYLMSSLIFSLTFPVIPQFITVSTLPEWAEETIHQPISTIKNQSLTNYYTPVVEPEQSSARSATEKSTIMPSLFAIASFIYWLVVICLMLRLIFQVSSIVWQIRSNPKESNGDYYFVKSNLPAVCSFFNYIFWNEQLQFSPTERRQILEHELIHVKDKHTLDILFIELFVILLWFNPFVYAFKRAIKSVHEYIADNHVFHKLDFRSDYAQLLVKEAVLQSAPSLTNTFYNSLIKKRLIMLNKTTNPTRKLKLLVLIPIFSFLLFAFGIQKTVNAHVDSFIESAKSTSKITEKIENQHQEANLDLPDITTDTSILGKKQAINPKIIAEIEAQPNPWLDENRRKGATYIQIDNDSKKLFKADGSRKSLDELRTELVAKAKAKGQILKKEDIVFYTNNQMKEWTGIDMKSFKEVDQSQKGGVRFIWSGIENNKINDLSISEHQTFDLINIEKSSKINVQEYSIIIKRGDEKIAYEYSFPFPEGTNKFPAHIFQQLQQLETGDKVIFYDFKHHFDRQVILSRDKFEFEVK